MESALQDRYPSSPCTSLNKCPQNRRLPLDSALGKTSRATTVVLPHVLEKQQKNQAILELVASLFLKISFLLKKVNDLHLSCAPNLSSCMMFWEGNQKSSSEGRSFSFCLPCKLHVLSKPNAAQRNSKEDAPASM